MADSVIIEGYSDDALANLPDWAKDETLERILAVLKRSLKVEEEGFKKLEILLRQFTTGKTASGDVPDPDRIGRYNRNLDELLNNVDRETRQKKKKKKQDEEENRQRTAGAKIFGNMTKKALVFDAAIASLDYIVAKAIVAMASNVDVSTKLYTAGINVISASNGTADAFQTLAQLTMLAGVRLKEMERIFLKYGNTVTIFGAGKIQRATTLAQKNLSALGYSASESLEFTTAYMDSVKGFTKTQNMSEEQVAKQVANFAATIKKLSLTSGQSTEQLMVKFNALAKSTDAMILTSQVGAGASEKLLGILSGVTDDNIRKQLLATMVAPVKEIDKVITSFRAAGRADIAQRYMEMNARLKTAQTPEEANKIIKAFGDNLSLTNAEINQLKLMAMDTSSTAGIAAQETLNMVTSFQQLSKNTKILNQDEIDAANRSKAARDRIADAYNKILTSLSAIFAPTVVILEGIGWALEWVAKGFTWLGNTFSGGLFGSIIIVIGAISALGGTIAVIGWKIGLVFANVGKMVTNFGLALLKLPYTILKFPFTILMSVAGWLKSGLQFLFSGIQNLLPTINFGNIVLKITEWVSSIGTYLKNLLPNLWKPIAELFATGASKFSALFQTMGSWLGKIGGLFLKLLGPIAWLVTAFQAGKALGTYIYGLIKDFDWFQKGMDGLFSWLDHLLQYMPGQIGKDAEERIASKEKIKAEEEKTSTIHSEKIVHQEQKSIADATSKATAQKITETKEAAQKITETNEPTKVANRDLPISTPKPSTISDVSAEETEPVVKAQKEDPTTKDNETIAKSAPIAKEPEINSILKYQTSLLEQQLDKIVDLLAINRDQLKITRNT